MSREASPVSAGSSGTATTNRLAATAATEQERQRRRRIASILRNRNLMLGAGILLVLVVVGLLAPHLSPYDPINPDYATTLLSPSLSHPFGTDNFGRDIFTRVLYGIRIDLRVGVISVIPPFIIGLLLGSLAAYFGGVADTIVMRMVDVVQAFPFLVLVIAIVAILGPGLNNMYIAVAVTAWIVYARLIRGEILVEKQKEYVVAAQAMGGTNRRIIWHHLLPNTIVSSVVYSMADIALYILLAAGLSFLGLGAKPPSPEWGEMITEGQTFITTAWWMSALPGLAIIITGIALSLLGDGLSDVLRPGTR
ncbi:MAG TPA: ABC transporter permease [Thermomicrobiaceae bacterium]|nr:ABC transporter permease [Thermomicrobiaceae bacterium]